MRGLPWAAVPFQPSPSRRVVGKMRSSSILYAAWSRAKYSWVINNAPNSFSPCLSKGRSPPFLGQKSQMGFLGCCECSQLGRGEGCGAGGRAERQDLQTWRKEAGRRGEGVCPEALQQDSQSCSLGPEALVAKTVPRGTDHVQRAQQQAT